MGASGEHAHGETHVIVKISGEDTPLTIGTADTYQITDHQAVLVDAWRPHRSERKAGDQTELLVFSFAEDWLDGIAPDRAREAPVFTRNDIPIDSTLIGASHALLRLMRVPRSVSASAIEKFASDIATYVFAAYARRGARRGGMIDGRIRAAVEMIEADPLARIDAAALSAATGLSRSRLFDVFRASLGLSPGQYADALKLQRAIAALSGGSDPLAQIALDLGFESQGNFTRFFRRQTGVTPSQFRRAAVLAVDDPPPTEDMAGEGA